MLFGTCKGIINSNKNEQTPKTTIYLNRKRQEKSLCHTSLGSKTLSQKSKSNLQTTAKDESSLSTDIGQTIYIPKRESARDKHGKKERKTRTETTTGK